MKKIVTLALTVALAAGTFASVGCDAKTSTATTKVTTTTPTK